MTCDPGPRPRVFYSHSDSFRYSGDPFEGGKLRKGVQRSEVDDAIAPDNLG